MNSAVAKTHISIPSNSFPNMIGHDWKETLRNCGFNCVGYRKNAAYALPNYATAWVINFKPVSFGLYNVPSNHQNQNPIHIDSLETNIDPETILFW